VPRQLARQYPRRRAPEAFYRAVAVAVAADLPDGASFRAETACQDADGCPAPVVGRLAAGRQWVAPGEEAQPVVRDVEEPPEVQPVVRAERPVVRALVAWVPGP
jgi:hypothetical protein